MTERIITYLLSALVVICCIPVLWVGLALVPAFEIASRSQRLAAGRGRR